MLLKIRLNGEEYEKETTAKGLKKAILSFKPDWLHTDIFITLVDGESERIRHLTLVQGKKLFVNEDFLDVMVMNLTMK